MTLQSQAGPAINYPKSGFLAKVWARLEEPAISWFVDISQWCLGLASVLVILGVLRICAAAGMNPDYVKTLESLDYYYTLAMLGTVGLFSIGKLISGSFKKNK